MVQERTGAGDGENGGGRTRVEEDLCEDLDGKTRQGNVCSCGGRVRLVSDGKSGSFGAHVERVAELSLMSSEALSITSSCSNSDLPDVCHFQDTLVTPLCDTSVWIACLFRFPPLIEIQPS